jgi:hypothetical protein
MKVWHQAVCHCPSNESFPILSARYVHLMRVYHLWPDVDCNINSCCRSLASSENVPFAAIVRQIVHSLFLSSPPFSSSSSISTFSTRVRPFLLLLCISFVLSSSLADGPGAITTTWTNRSGSRRVRSTANFQTAPTQSIAIGGPQLFSVISSVRHLHWWLVVGMVVFVLCDWCTTPVVFFFFFFLLLVQFSHPSHPHTHAHLFKTLQTLGRQYCFPVFRCAGGTANFVCVGQT